MNPREFCTRMGLLALLAMTGVSAAAQTVYRCGSAGSAYISDRPCTAGTGSKIGGYGPVTPRDAAPTSSNLPPVNKAPDHLPYLSPGCASISDAIRTGPARGLKQQAIADLRSEYQAKCADDESEARQQLARERNNQRKARRSEQAAAQAEQSRAAREHDQCQELLRILHAKRQRLANMSAGELADFERSDANYRSRCTAG